MRSPTTPTDEGLTVSKPTLLTDGSDDAFRGLLHDMFSVAARLEQIRGRFGAFIGLTGPQYTILAAIRQFGAGGGVGVSRLAERLHLSGAFVTIETNKLAKLGLITKTPNALDLRRVDLALTARGSDALAALAPLQREVNDTLFEPLSAPSFAALCATMRALAESGTRAAALADYLMDDTREGGGA